MSKRRLKVNDKGELVDPRTNTVVGRITSLTVELDDGGDIGGDEQPPTTKGGEDGGPGEGGAGQTDRVRAVNKVWGHYAAVMTPRSDAPDAEQRRIIQDALKVANGSNYDEKADELCRAIDGCAASGFHMGQNDRRKKYNRLSQILKGKRGGKTTREQIDMFLEIAEKSGSESRVTSVSNARVQQAKRDVLDGWEFPNDERVVERANEAKAWLREQGFKIEYEENGRPRFVEPS